MQVLRNNLLISSFLKFNIGCVTFMKAFTFCQILTYLDAYLYLPNTYLLTYYLLSTAWKVSKYGGFSGLHFAVFSPNAGRHGPEKPLYLSTFHVVYDICIRLIGCTLFVDAPQIVSIRKSKFKLKKS